MAVRGLRPTGVRGRHRNGGIWAHRPLLTQAGLRTLTLDGSTPATEREGREAAFRAGTADVFLLSLRAAATSLNLTAATYAIHLDPWWNPAVEDQATDRAHRIGQDRPLTAIRMVARGTIEEAVLSLHEEKRQLAASILDGADAAARLDGEDLLDLIRKKTDDTINKILAAMGLPCPCGA